MPSRPDSWKFEWRRTWDTVWVDSFVSRWRCILDASTRAHVYHRPELIRRWVETRGVAFGAEPHFGLATSSSGAQMILPWIIIPYGG